MWSRAPWQQQCFPDPVKAGDRTMPPTRNLSQQVEEVGLDAYTGRAQFLIGNDDLLHAALSTHAEQFGHYQLDVTQGYSADRF